MKSKLFRRNIFFFDVHQFSILIRLSNIDYLILIIHIFLKNIKYLKFCVKILKSLLSSNFCAISYFKRLYNNITIVRSEINNLARIHSKHA